VARRTPAARAIATLYWLVRRKGLQSEIKQILRIISRAVREARDHDQRPLIDKLTAIKIHLQLLMRHMSPVESRRRRKKK
jgi:hypothetical protein